MRIRSSLGVHPHHSQDVWATTTSSVTEYSPRKDWCIGRVIVCIMMIMSAAGQPYKKESIVRNFSRNKKELPRPPYTRFCATRRAEEQTYYYAWGAEKRKSGKRKLDSNNCWYPLVIHVQLVRSQRGASTDISMYPTPLLPYVLHYILFFSKSN